MTGLDAAVARIVEGRFGTGCQVAGRHKLSERAAIVERVTIEGAPASTVIVKHLGEPVASAADLVADHPEFANELLNYRLLALDRSHAVTAELIGSDASGLLLLADLGDGEGTPPRGFDFLVPALARSLALLHGSTRSLAAVYDSMRAEAGLGSREDDRRRYGIPGVRRLFQAGAARCLMLDAPPRQTAALAREFEAIEAIIAYPGDWLALIHDDLANARQTVEVGNILYLLDFEQAKFSHSLLDLVKPMIGKFEVDERRGVSTWQCPGFPMALAEQYRAIRATQFGERFSDADWRANLAAALIHGAMALVGRMAAWDPRRPLVGSRSQNINAIVHRLSVLLADMDAFPAVRGFASDHVGQLLDPGAYLALRTR